MALREMTAFRFSNGAEQYILEYRRDALAAAGDEPVRHDRLVAAKNKTAVMISSMWLELQLTQGQHFSRLGNERILARPRSARCVR